MEQRLLATENIRPISNAICKNIETRLSQTLNSEQRHQVQAVLIDQIRACFREGTPGTQVVPSTVNKRAAAETLKKVLPTFRFGHPALVGHNGAPGAADPNHSMTRNEYTRQSRETPTRPATGTSNLDSLLANILQEREAQNHAANNTPVN